MDSGAISAAWLLLAVALCLGAVLATCTFDLPWMRSAFIALLCGIYLAVFILALVADDPLTGMTATALAFMPLVLIAGNPPDDEA